MFRIVFSQTQKAHAMREGAWHPLGLFAKALCGARVVNPTSRITHAFEPWALSDGCKACARIVQKGSVK